MFKFFQFFLLFFLPSIAFSQEFETVVYNPDLSDSESKVINQYISKSIQITSPFIRNQVSRIEFQIHPTKDNYFAVSNADPKNCQIKIFITPGKIENEDFFVFSLNHEIAHCYKGKKIFFEPIKWETISDIEKNKINDLLTYETILKREKSLTTTHSLIILHEITADVYATYWTFPFYPHIGKLINKERTIENETSQEQLTHLFVDLNKLSKNKILNREYIHLDLDIFIEKEFISFLKKKYNL